MKTRLILQNMLKKKHDIDLGLFFELAGENKIIYNQTPVNTLIEAMEKPRNVFFMNGYFSLGDDGEIYTNRFFKDGIELPKVMDKILYKYDDHPTIYYTGKIYRYFRNSKRVDRSEQGRGANNFNIIQEYKVINCCILSGNACVVNCNNFFFKKDFSMEYFEFIQSYKRRSNVMTRCKIPRFCERYKVDNGIYDDKSKIINPRSV